MRTIEVCDVRIPRTASWLIPVLAMLLLGCSSGKSNSNTSPIIGGAGASGRADAGIPAGSGHETYLLKMESVQGVSSNPPVPTTFTLASASYITRVWTYHDSAKIGGKSPTISFKNTATGTLHGPWPQTGYKTINSALDASKNDPGCILGPPDNYWMAFPATVIPAGTYQVIDSDPATWSYTSDLGNRGVTWIYGWAGGPPAGDAGTGIDAGTSFSLPYTPGELAGQTALYDQLTPALDKTAAALVQAVLAVNSFLFTDPAATSFATLQTRKAEADQALEVLAKYAAATESLIDAYSPSPDDGGVTQVDAGAADALMSMADSGTADAPTSTDARAATDTATLMPMRLKGPSPEEVLAIVSSAPANAQIKTLMKTYSVNAKKAQLILNTAMAGLDAQAWNDEAKSMDTLMRQATLVKETAKLGVTLVGTAMTAGGVSGVLTVAQSAKAIVSGTKGVIAVAKAGAELIMGKDLVIKEGSKESLVMTTVDTVSDIIAIGGFQKILNGTATTKDKLKGIATIASKVKNAFENQTITFGELKVDFKDGLSIGSSIDVGYINSLLGGLANPPSTLPGTYRIYGIPNVVTTMPLDIMDAITKFLPIADIVNGVLIAPITPESLDAGTPDTGRPEAGTLDARTPDTRTPDTRVPDTRTADVSVQTCPNGRYTILDAGGTVCAEGTGLVKDSSTGLVWMRFDSAWLTHAAADDFCSGKGMRLPTVDELMGIKNPVDGCAWSCGWKTWTSTPDPNVKGYWYYDYYSDQAIVQSCSSDIATAGALCVR